MKKSPIQQIMASTFVRRKTVVLSLVILLISVLYQQGLSLAQPCQNLAIIRLDTYSDVAHSIVLLNDNNSDPSPSFRCQSHLSSIGSLVWLPSPETEYFSVLRELQNITQIYLSRYEQQILGDLVVSAHGQQEGFYLCTNVFSFGCYLGVFQRISLVARNVRFNHIYNTGFEVSWDPPVHSALVKGYQLTVATQDGRTIVQKQYPVANASYTHVVTCIAPGKTYSVSVEALYNFQKEGFYSVYDTVEVSTPADSSIKECIVEINSAIVTVWAEEKPRTLRVAWYHSTLPSGVKIAKSVIQHKKARENYYIETEVPGSDSEISLDGLEFGTTYLVRVAVHPTNQTFKGSLLPTKYLGVFSADVVATTFSLPQSPILIASPTDRTSHSITVGWTNDQVNQLPMRHVVVNVARDGNEVGRVRADADERKVSVFGLLADTEYLVTVWAENSIGQSSNHSLLIKTRQAVIEAPMNLQANVLSATSIEITWNQSGNKTTIHNGISYEITLEATDGSEYQPRKDSFQTPNQHFTVQNLHPFSGYLLSVTSVDQTGARSETAEVKAMTFSAAPSGPPLFITADLITSQSISLSWTEPAAGHRNGIVTSYTVHYQVTNTFSSEVEIEKGPCDVTSTVTLANLMPAHAYQFKVAAATDGGRGNFSDWIEVITSEEAPGPIVDLLVVPQSSSSDIHIQWSPPLEVDASLVKYLVTVGEFEGPNITEPLHTLNGRNTSVTVNAQGLEPGKPYAVSVSAITGGGEGPPVKKVFFVEELVPEVYVSGVKIHRITPTSLEVSWNEVSLHDARGTPAYHVSYWKGNTTNVIAKETVESMILLEGLDSASVYSIAIQVKTAEGMGPPSKPISVVLVTQAAGPALALALTSTAPSILGVERPSGEAMSDVFNFSKFSVQIVFGSGLGIGIISTLLLGALLFLLYRCCRSFGSCCSTRLPLDKSEFNDV